MQHQLALLLGRLNPYETHGWAPHCLTDCFRVGGIVLIALDVGPHILRWHQTNHVAQFRQLARPMVRPGTGLHTDQARRRSFEERHNLSAAKLLSDDDLLGRANAVNLEHVLGDIQTDRGNLHVDGSPHVIRLRRTTLWHFDAGSGRRPPHQYRTNAWQRIAAKGRPPRDGLLDFRPGYFDQAIAFQRYAFRKASRSALIVSALVVGMPCGNALYVFSVPF